MQKPIVQNTPEQSGDFADMSLLAINDIAMSLDTTGISVVTGMVTFCTTMAAQFDRNATADFLRVLADMAEQDAFDDPDLEEKRSSAAAKIFRAHDLTRMEPMGST